jgi:sugar/nucleoside kinase (ribokinase family)
MFVLRFFRYGRMCKTIGLVYIDTMKSIDVIAMGIAVMDILARPADRTLFDRANTRVGEIAMATGGDAANQAADLARLGCRVVLSCRVGDDALGRMFLSEMASRGVDVSHVAVSAQSVTTAAIVLVSPDGQRSILHRPGNNYDFSLADVDLDLIAEARALSVGSLYGCPRLEEEGLEVVLAHAKRHGLLTFADMASDKKGAKLNGIRPFLPYIDWFAPSDYDSAQLTDGLSLEDAAQAFLDAGAGNVVIKLGARGAYARCYDFAGYIPAFDIDAVDTTGSGDAFCAGLIHSLLDGKAAEEALDFACACGAMGALHTGAATAPFSPEAVSAFMTTAKRRRVSGGEE